MTTMQTKILDALAAIATSHGFDPRRQYRYANTGTVYFQIGFDTHLKVDFSFQGAYVTLAYSGEIITAAQLHDRSPEYRLVEADDGAPTLTYHVLNYDDGASITTMLALITRLIADQGHPRGTPAGGRAARRVDGQPHREPPASPADALATLTAILGEEVERTAENFPAPSWDDFCADARRVINFSMNDPEEEI